MKIVHRKKTDIRPQKSYPSKLRSNNMDNTSSLSLSCVVRNKDEIHMGCLFSVALRATKNMKRKGCWFCNPLKSVNIDTDVILVDDEVQFIRTVSVWRCFLCYRKWWLVVFRAMHIEKKHLTGRTRQRLYTDQSFKHCVQYASKRTTKSRVAPSVCVLWLCVGWNIYLVVVHRGEHHPLGCFGCRPS